MVPLRASGRDMGLLFLQLRGEVKFAMDRLTPCLFMEPGHLRGALPTYSGGVPLKGQECFLRDEGQNWVSHAYIRL